MLKMILKKQNKDWHQALPIMNLPLKSHEDTKVERKLPAFRIVTTETDDVEGKKYLCTKILMSCIYKRVQRNYREMVHYL